MSVYILATLDTKGHEADFVRQRLEQLGVATTLVDVGCLGTPQVEPDIPREEVFRAAGMSVAEMHERNDRGAAVIAASEGSTNLIAEHFALGRVRGVLGLGGSAGTSIATTAMRGLPLGVPKLMVSTVASGEVRHHVGAKDIMMFNSVVDLLGVNRISRLVLVNAAHAMAGMVQHDVPAVSEEDRPILAATMFGVTTPCIERAREVLQAAGYEVLVFHATGIGGQAMESLIDDGLIAGVLDITTTELADELVGGVLSAGPKRLSAAGRRGIPQVVSVGATDMVNFHARNTIPAKFEGRNFYQHNQNVTLMRTTGEESFRIGQAIGRKVAASQGPSVMMLPAQGVSAIDQRDQPFEDREAREQLFAGVRETAGDTAVIEVDAHINDAGFAEAAAERLLKLLDA